MVFHCIFLYGSGFLVYDVTNRSSFENLDHWMTEVETYITKGDAVKMLVGNKIDMVSLFFVSNTFCFATCTSLSFCVSCWSIFIFKVQNITRCSQLVVSLFLLLSFRSQVFFCFAFSQTVKFLAKMVWNSRSATVLFSSRLVRKQRKVCSAHLRNSLRR